MRMGKRISALTLALLITGGTVLSNTTNAFADSPAPAKAAISTRALGPIQVGEGGWTYDPTGDDFYSTAQTDAIMDSIRSGIVAVGGYLNPAAGVIFTPIVAYVNSMTTGKYVKVRAYTKHDYFKYRVKIVFTYYEDRDMKHQVGDPIERYIEQDKIH